MPILPATNYSELFAQQHRLAQLGVDNGAGLSSTPAITLVYSGGANYTATAGAIGTNAVVGPDGTATSADTFTDSGAASTHFMQATAATTVPNNSWVRLVLYCKAGPAFTSIAFGHGTVAQVMFDVLNGVVLQTNMPPSVAILQQSPMIFGGIQPLTPGTLTTAPVNATNPTNNWYKILVQLFANNVSLGQASGATVNVQPAIFANSGRSYTGASTVCFTVAKPPPSLPGNYSELASLAASTALYGRNSG